MSGALKLGDGSVLELSGGDDPDTVIVLRIGGRMLMQLRAKIVLTDGLRADRTLVYAKDRKCLMVKRLPAATRCCAHRAG